MSTGPRIPDPKPEVEGAFVEYVKADPVLAAIQVLRACDRSAEVRVPYIFCWAAP
jgi:hypothetical protein